MTSETSPAIYIIAGPNGAGKTTFANLFLPKYVQCSEFLNADLIAAGLSPFAPERQNLRASELMLERMASLIAARTTFAFETTLAARSYARQIPQWQRAGYTVHLFFLWLPTVDLAIERVANRVRQGGHHIPEPTIRQRFSRGLSNFHHLYRPLIDHWMFFDGSQVPPREIARWDQGGLTLVEEASWQSVQQQTRT